MPVASGGAFRVVGPGRANPLGGAFDSGAVLPGEEIDLWLRATVEETRDAIGWGVARRVRPPAHGLEVTIGPARTLNVQVVGPDELEGVLAHELAHIRNRDMLISTVAATMAGAVSHLATMALWFGGRDEDSNPIAGILMMIVAPIAALIIQTAISRQREFEADRVGAGICGKPLALASALRKLDAAAHRIPMQVAPAAAPLAQVNPLAASGGGVARLFSTHPPTAERVARLEELGRQP